MNGILNPLEHVDRAFIYIIGFSLFLLLFITVLMIFFVFKYSRERHPEPSDIRGNWLLETIWTLIPTAIALSMFYFGWSSYIGLRNVPPGAIEIDIYAQQYSWIVVYPNDLELEDEIVVPKGSPVKLNITSEDVIHGLFIPTFRVKVDAVKGIKTYVWFYPDKEGEYHFHCTEFCGTGHPEMNGVLRVVSEEEYEQWLEEEG